MQKVATEQRRPDNSDMHVWCNGVHTRRFYHIRSSGIWKAA